MRTTLNGKILEDVIVNLFTKKFTKKEIIDALAWGEKNTDVYYPLIKKHQPDYYIEGVMGKDCPIKSCTLIIDLGIKYN